MPATWLLLLILASPPDPVLAYFEGGQVTASDLAREMAFLTRDERTFRRVQGFDDAASRRDWIERVALRRIAARLAASEGLTSEGLTSDTVAAREAREVVEEFWLSRWETTCYGYGLELPTDEALAREIEPTLPILPERLDLAHIFLRAEAEAELAAAEARLAEFATRATSLAAFEALAREHSASETARRGGHLGWMHRGWLPAGVEEVLYTLPAGSQSPPLRARGGVHLFWIIERRPAEKGALAPRLKRRRAELEAAARRACRERRLGEARAALGVEALGLSPEQLLLRHALLQGLPTAEERARLQDLEENVWLQALIEARVGARLGSPAEGELERRFEAAPERYRSPQELAVRRLRVPIPHDRDPLALHDTLRAAAARVAAGELGFEALSELAGSTAVLDTQPRAAAIDVASFLGPSVFDIIRDLPQGGVAGPIQDEGNLVIVRIDDKWPSRSLSFSEARASLYAEWTTERRRTLRAEVAGELLRLHSFALTPAGEAALNHHAQPATKR